MIVSDVVAAAHAAHTAGCRSCLEAIPAPASPGTGRCARCGAAGELTAVRQVVSNRFTGYHSWIHPDGVGLCAACSWGYRHRPLRTDPHLVSRTRCTLTALTDSDLAVLLAAPVRADAAVLIPARPGRKHLIPDAEWGHVTVADANVTWGPREVDTLAAMTRLRAAGFTATDLAAPAPPFAVLRALPPDALPAVLADWGMLDPWRSAAPWWQVGLRASIPTRESET